MNFAGAKPVHAAAPRPHPTVVPHWLAHLGAVGLFFVSVVDSSIIPLPIPGSTDLLLLLLVAHRGNPWMLALVAFSGSVVGGYTTWHLGRKGGEAALHRYVPARILGRVVAWVQQHPVLAVFLPAILPPPIPLSPFLLASGALGISRNRFLAAFGTARALRYSLIAWLGVTYGRRMVRIWTGTLNKWSAPLLWVFGAVVVGGIIVGVLKFRALRRAEARGAPALNRGSAQAD